MKISEAIERTIAHLQQNTWVNRCPQAGTNETDLITSIIRATYNESLIDNALPYRVMFFITDNILKVKGRGLVSWNDSLNKNEFDSVLDVLNKAHTLAIRKESNP